MRSLAAERELAEMFTPRAARAKAVGTVSVDGGMGRGKWVTEGGEELARARFPLGD